MCSDATRAPAGDGTDAAAYVRAWRLRSEALDVERLRDLRQLSEVEAARRFAQWLRPTLPCPLRESSGLVEQQRIFARLRAGR